MIEHFRCPLGSALTHLTLKKAVWGKLQECGQSHTQRVPWCFFFSVIYFLWNSQSVPWGTQAWQETVNCPATEATSIDFLLPPAVVYILSLQLFIRLTLSFLWCWQSNKENFSFLIPELKTKCQNTSGINFMQVNVVTVTPISMATFLTTLQMVLIVYLQKSILCQSGANCQNL